MNSELCAADTWQLQDGFQDWVQDIASLSSVASLPWVLEGPTSPFFPKRSLLPYGRIFSWAGIWMEPRGEQPSVPAGAPWRQLLLCHLPGCRGCPTLLPALLPALPPRTGFPLPGEADGSYMRLVSLPLSAFLVAPGACPSLLLTATENEKDMIKQERLLAVDAAAIPGLSFTFERRRETIE